MHESGRLILRKIGEPKQRFSGCGLLLGSYTRLRALDEHLLHVAADLLLVGNRKRCLAFVYYALLQAIAARRKFVQKAQILDFDDQHQHLRY